MAACESPEARCDFAALVFGGQTASFARIWILKACVLVCITAKYTTGYANQSAISRDFWRSLFSRHRLRDDRVVRTTVERLVPTIVQFGNRDSISAITV